MSGYTNFAIIGAGVIGSYIVAQLLKDKASGIVKDVVVLTRQGSNTIVQGDAKAIQVEYSNHESIKYALTGVDVVISTVPVAALDVQGKIAVAAKEAGVKLFVPSEFGGITKEDSEDIRSVKANVQGQLKVLGMPYAAFYTGPFPDYIWASMFNLDVTSGKVSVGGDGNKQISFTARPDIARFVSYVLLHFPPEQLRNRAFAIAGDNKSFNEIFKEYEEKTGKKLHVTYVPVSELEARIASDPEDMAAQLHKFWATAGAFQQTDNHVYPNWNPSPAIDNMPVA